MGWFEPTEIGERLMPAMTFLGPYHDRISAEMADASLPSGDPLSAKRRKTLAREALMYKHTDEAGLALEALQLELRNADGTVVATEHISVQDTEYLLALDTDDGESHGLEPVDDSDMADEMND